MVTIETRTRGYHNPAATDEWGTPCALYERLNREFGFGWDLAASPENHKAARWFGRQEDGSFLDGLAADWDDATASGLVPAYLNPPYSDIEPWAAKASRSFVVMLAPVNSDRAWWQEYAMQASEIRLIRGRLTYEGPQKYPARFPSAVLIFRPWWRGTRPEVVGWNWRTM